MRWLRLPLWTQSCAVWVNQGQLQSPVWLSIKLLFRFYDGKWREAFTSLHYPQICGRKRKEKAHGTLCCCFQKSNNDRLLKATAKSSGISEVSIQLFASAVTENYSCNLTERDEVRNDVSDYWIMVLDCLYPSRFPGGLTFRTVCLVVRWRLRCDGSWIHS